jgi:hypothetical protein
MSKKLLFALFVLFGVSLSAKSDKSSQSFLFTRPAHQNLALHQAFWYGSLFNKDKKTAVQVNSHYQKSWRSDKIRQYFLLADRTLVKVNRTATDRDVLPEWLGLPDDFSGLVTFSPEQEQIGGSIEARRNIGPLFGFDFFKDWWIQAALCVASVKNNLKLVQSNVQNPAASTLDVYDITTAFNNPDWTYSKINGEQTRTGVSEVRIGLGTTLLSDGRSYAATYSAVSIPGRKKVSNTYLFDSQVGFNGHVGVIWGANLQAPLTRVNDPFLVTFNINLENNFLIRNHQYRTFDLKTKEWSRFLNMRKQDQTIDTTTPGVNVLTHLVRVSPHAIIDFSTSLRCTINSLEAEIGYGLWAHGGDKIKITNPVWKEEYGIAGSTTNTSASESTIKTRASNDSTFTLIKQTNLNLTSAEMLPVAVHKVHASLGYRGGGKRGGGHFGIGAYGEFPRNSTKALATWGFWAKAGGAF